MRAVVTALRAPTGATALAAAATMDYVSGGRQPTLLRPSDGEDVVGYFADQTPEGPGRWLGDGAGRFGLSGTVERHSLEALLRGDDPSSGSPLLSGRGSNRRAQAGRRIAPEPVSWDEAHYTIQDAATLAGVSDRYLRRVAGRTRAMLTRTGGDASTLAAIEGDGRAFLVASQGDDSRWRVTRDELFRFVTARRAASVTMGFDVTFSVPKSVSVLWAIADRATQAEVVAAFDQAVDTGVAYLERHAAVTGRGEDRIQGRGLTAASFTHATSRRLDPQLHAHVIVANAVETATGTHRALDGSALFAHARTAGYLAGAQLCHELTERLGVSWRPVRSGIVEVAGVPPVAVEAMSQRRQEIDRLAEQLGVTTATGRRSLALRSRTAKQVASLETLRDDWADRLAAVGFDAAAHGACLDPTRVPTAPTTTDAATLFASLVRHDGLTAHAATFTRHEAVQAVADWSVDRLDANAIERLADEFLNDPRVLPLALRAPDTQARSPHGATAAERRFTTRAMVRAEARVLAAFRTGLRADVGRVDPALVARTVGAEAGLGDDQAAAITRLCRSGQRIQCLVGPAGSGKTHTLRTAAATWHAAGYQTVGTAVQGTAAENLEAATGIPTRTLAALLARAERDGPGTFLDARTVVVVDEASAVGTFDLVRLLDIIEAADANLVLVGDPAQHTAVSAGGAFAALTRRWGNQSARLLGTRRQASDAMASVRQAVAELRARDTDVALHRLVVDGRVHDAPTRDEAYDAMITDWAADRASPTTDRQPRRVCMITDDHRTRRALIDRARAHLQSSGQLGGPALVIAGQEFQAGDEIIARAPARELHPPGAPDRHVRNGTCGRVVAIHQPAGGTASLTVDFDSRGLIVVPAASLNTEVRPGIVGVLTHSYALTSHAAQGATYDTARAFATESTSPAALYVAASRGRDDLRVYTAPKFTSVPGEHGDEGGVNRDRETGLQALARSVRNRGDDCLAVERDTTLLARVDSNNVDQEPRRYPQPEQPTVDVASAQASELILNL